MIYIVTDDRDISNFIFVEYDFLGGYIQRCTPIKLSATDLIRFSSLSSRIEIEIEIKFSFIPIIEKIWQPRVIKVLSSFIRHLFVVLLKMSYHFCS